MTAKGLSFSPKQLRVLTWWQDPRWDALICDGAVRSGKTFAMGLGFFLWAQARFSGRQFGLCGKTIVSLRRNLLAELVPYLRRVGMDIRLRCAGCGHEVLLPRSKVEPMIKKILSEEASQ